MNIMMLSQKMWDQRAKDIGNRLQKKNKGAPDWKAIQRELGKAILHRKPDCFMIDEDLYRKVKKHCLSKDFSSLRKPYRKRRNRNAI